MAITSTINVDTVGGTIASSVYHNGSSLIDTLTYTLSSNNIMCATNSSAITLSVQDYLALINFYVAFNTLIQFTYSPSQAQTTPFSLITFEQLDDGTSQLDFRFLPSNIPCFYYTCTYPSGSVIVAARNLSSTLSYAQWLFFLYLLSNFKLAVLNDYNI
jgi:hypothetical protein